MRTIVREPGFDDMAAGLLGTIQLADKALEGFEWSLARETDFEDPSIYHYVGATKYGPLLAFKTPPIGPSPGVCLLLHLTYSETEVHLRRISSSAADDESEDDGE